ncbi:MAG: S8 family serine peptidase [Cryomorphaceae bacterium]
MKTILAVTLGTTLIFGAAFAQRETSSPTLKLAGGAFEIAEIPNDLSSSTLLAEWPVVEGRAYGIIALEHLPDRQAKKNLEAKGIRILSFLPERFYLVSLAEGANLQTLEDYSLTHAGPYLNVYKWLVDYEQVPEQAVLSNNRRSVILTGFSDVPLQTLAEEVLAREQVTLLEHNETFGFLNVSVEATFLEKLSKIESIQSIAWVYPEGQAENYTSRTLARTRYLSHDNSNAIAYDGSGVSVAVQDNGTIGPHIDYHGRVLGQFTSENEGDHADHVTGTVGGAGNLNPRHQGQAEGADIYVYKAYPDYNAISNLDSHYYSYDIHLTSTSYSDGCNAGYTARARLVDLQSIAYDKLIHVYSAGNAGTSNCGYGAGNNWGNITGGHKMGKNVITVGNLSKADVLATGSSRGPANDGRIKPDITAQGTSVTSTIAGNEYDTYSGTSMACPNVAGSLALLYEAFEDVHGSAPDGGLIKAIVLNTAQDLGNAGPDFKHGWGRINARRAFSVIEQESFSVDSLASGGGANTHLVTVSPGTTRLRVMVYWTDPAASISASTALVNDLDLSGTSPSNDSLLPYVLNPSPNAITLDEPASYGQDHLNNMEQIEVLQPTAGTYTFQVSPYLVPQGPQEYFFVYYTEVDPLVLTFPVGGESLAPQTDELIRWDGDMSGDLTIEYTTDGGLEWDTIAQGVGVEQGYFEWTVPMIAEGDVQLRLAHDSVSVTSDSFSIMPVPSNLNIAFACPDAIGLIWDPLAAALSFDIYKLGSKYMDSLGTSVNNEFTDTTSNPYSNMLWYSVSADGPDGARSERMIAVKKPPGLQNCFLANDLGVTKVFPNISHVFDCHGTESNIGFGVENTGVTPSGPFLASFYGPSGLIESDSFTNSIAPLETDTLFFSNGVALDSGVHEYYVLLDMSGDQNPYNDTARMIFKAGLPEVQALVWDEHFDQMTFVCDDQAYCGSTSCPLLGGWINAENGTFDDIDWRVNSGGTPTANTGPSEDNTTQTSLGKYIYLEASESCLFQEAILISPCVDLTGATEPMLTFYYNMRGFDMGELHVDVFDGSVWHEDLAFFEGHQGTPWRFVEVELDAFNDKQINVRFRGITGDGVRSDMALDDISITHPPVADFEFFTQSNGQTVVFNDLSAYADTMAFYLGDGSMVLDSVPDEHTYALQMNYTVKQVVSNTFVTDSLSLDIVNLGLQQGSTDGISIYPNPAAERILIETIGGARFEEAELWTMDGRQVGTYQRGEGGRFEIDVRALNSGAYTLKVIGESVIQHPVIIAH